LATHATLYEEYPPGVAAFGALKDDSKHVVYVHPILGSIGAKHRAGLFIVCCGHDTNVAGLDKDVALKL